MDLVEQENNTIANKHGRCLNSIFIQTSECIVFNSCTCGEAESFSGIYGKLIQEYVKISMKDIVE
jgi:site-specific recombinase